MTYKDAAKQYIEIQFQILEPVEIHQAKEDAAFYGFLNGVYWATNKAIEILDSMFMDRANISVDEWFRDSKFLFKGRETFKKKMEE